MVRTPDIDKTKIRFIGYWRGAFYVSQYEWQRPSMWDSDFRAMLTWVASPPWIFNEHCRQVYQYLKARVSLDCWWDGEWMAVDFSQENTESEAA